MSEERDIVKCLREYADEMQGYTREICLEAASVIEGYRAKNVGRDEGWQDISTAPKDALVIVWFGEGYAEVWHTRNLASPPRGLEGAARDARYWKPLTPPKCGAERGADTAKPENVGRGEGWVLVPKEATAPMIVAGVAAWKANAFASISGVWEAMLSNAPKRAWESNRRE